MKSLKIKLKQALTKEPLNEEFLKNLVQILPSR
jgi:hypothetical protein